MDGYMYSALSCASMRSCSCRQRRGKEAARPRIHPLASARRMLVPGHRCIHMYMYMYSAARRLKGARAGGMRMRSGLEDSSRAVHSSS